ncbi:MAG: PhoH family protein [Rhodospirillales bacterium]
MSRGRSRRNARGNGEPAVALSAAPGAGNGANSSQQMTFANNGLAAALFGSHHAHLAQIEQGLGVTVHARGNEVTISGEGAAVDRTAAILAALYDRLQQGLDVDTPEVDAMLRMSSGGAAAAGDPKEGLKDAGVAVQTRNKMITARTSTQADYLRAIDENPLVFGLGPAGTGKTYLAVAKAVERLVQGRVDRIILSRPAVEAGEQLGFLPGDMREKVDPYLRPLYDALYDMLPDQQVVKRLESGEIEVAPLAFMRGRTLANAFVILDEAQNTTPVQMKMFLTRLGENSAMVVTGDLSQVDLPRGTRSGLRDAEEVLAGTKGIRFVEFTEKDVVRHPLVSRIVHAYQNVETARRAGARYEHYESEREQEDE